MCTSGASSSTEKPEKLLADLLSKELELHVDKVALRLFVRANWSQIRKLGHAIHGSDVPINLPLTEGISEREGDAFTSWVPWDRRGYGAKFPDKVHAIKFSDGSIWDTCNGWRPRPC